VGLLDQRFVAGSDWGPAAGRGRCGSDGHFYAQGASVCRHVHRIDEPNKVRTQHRQGCHMICKQKGSGAAIML
jgi:hypothetical protein